MHGFVFAVISTTLAMAACGPSETPAGETASSQTVQRKEGANQARDARRAADAFWGLERGRMEAAFERRRVRDKAFRLATSSSMTGGMTYLGIICSNPRQTASLPLEGGGAFGVDDTPHSDAEIQRANSVRATAEKAAARTGNLQIVDRVDFPYPDVCGPAANDGFKMAADVAAGRRPVREVSGPSRDLHDAARRGTVDEVRSWLARSNNVNAPDSFGLTPLAWATLRDRPEVVDLLLDEGASVVASVGRPGEHSAAWFAARHGDDAMLDRFTRFPGRAKRAGVPEWPRAVIEAALIGGSEAVLSKVSRERHEPISRADTALWTEKYPHTAGQLARLNANFDR